MKRRAKGEGSLLKINGCRFWYCQYFKDGRQIRVSSKSEVRQEALAVLRRLMGDSERGLPPITDSRKICYADLRAGLLANYKEQGNRSLQVRADGTETIIGLPQLDEYFGFGPDSRGPSVVKITTETGRAFAKSRQAEGAGNAVINRSLAALRRMLNIAVEEHKIPSAPVIRLLKEPQPRKGFLELPKFQQLLAALPAHLQPYVMFLYHCGARRGEAEMITWSQVDLQRSFVRFEADQTKTEEARVVPLPKQLVAMLVEVEPKEGRVFDTTNIRKEWMKACAAVGLGRIIPVEGKPYDPKYTGLTLHDFRRSAARNLVTVAGVPERVAMRITGHKTRSVFDRYHIVSTDDLSGAMSRWEAATENLLPQGPVSERLVKKPGRRPAKLMKTMVALPGIEPGFED
jgi:integrase